MSEFILKEDHKGVYLHKMMDEGVKETIDPDLAKSFRTRIKASVYKAVHGLRNFEIVPYSNEKDSA